MSDGEYLKQVRTASPAWLREQIWTSNRLIHETEQLLRGATGPEVRGLQQALWTEKANRKVLQEELGRRNGDLR